MRLLILSFLLAAGTLSHAQVFMRAFDGAPALALGGATTAYPGTDLGIGTAAKLGMGDKLGFWAGSALPYSIGGWQSVKLQGLIGLNRYSGAGIEVVHAGTDAYTEQHFSLQYGRKLSEKLMIGANADVLRISQKEYGSVNKATFGLSLLARALPKLWIGARVQNPFQQKIGSDIIPSVLNIGACWKPSELLYLMAETEKDLERPAQIKAGIEYHPGGIFVVRAGMRTGPSRVGFGLGLRLKNGLRLDVSSEWHSVLGITPALMISWRKS
jgi:hypothetical protein